MIEWRVCWNASSNASFHGQTDWEAWDGPEDNQEDVRDAVEIKTFDGRKVPGLNSMAFESVLEASGFEWYVETREVSA